MALSVADLFPRTRKVEIDYPLQDGRRLPEAEGLESRLEDFSCLYCAFNGSDVEKTALSQFKAICDSRLPGMKRRSHTYNLLFREKINATLLMLTPEDVVTGGLTFRIIKLSTGFVILDALLIAVDPEYGNRGLASELLRLAELLLSRFVAKNGLVEGLVLTQVDDSSAAISFWKKQSLVDSEFADAVSSKLSQFEDRHRIYEHSIPMAKLLSPVTEIAALGSDSAVSLDLTKKKEISQGKGKTSIWDDLFATPSGDGEEYNITIDNVIAFRTRLLKLLNSEALDSKEALLVLSTVRLDESDDAILKLLLDEKLLSVFEACLAACACLSRCSEPEAASLRYHIVRHLRVLAPHVELRHLIKAPQLCQHLRKLTENNTLSQRQKQFLNDTVAKWALDLLNASHNASLIQHKHTPARALTSKPAQHEAMPSLRAAQAPVPASTAAPSSTARPVAPPSSKSSVPSVRKALRPLIKQTLYKPYAEGKISKSDYSRIARAAAEKFSVIIKKKNLADACLQDAQQLPAAIIQQLHAFVKTQLPRP